MKYTIVINQAKALELGIKNLNQAIIFDILTTASSWAEEIKIDDDTYFWVNRKTISNQLPLLKLKDDTVYRHLKNLHNLGLIEYIKSAKKDCIRISEKGKKYLLMEEKSSENLPKMVGTKSEKGVNSEANPVKIRKYIRKTLGKPFPTDKTISIYKTISDRAYIARVEPNFGFDKISLRPNPIIWGQKAEGEQLKVDLTSGRFEKMFKRVK